LRDERIRRGSCVMCGERDVGFGGVKVRVLAERAYQGMGR